METYLLNELNSIKWKLEEKIYSPDTDFTQDYKDILEDVDNAIDKLKKVIDLKKEGGN